MSVTSTWSLQAAAQADSTSRHLQDACTGRGGGQEVAAAGHQAAGGGRPVLLICCSFVLSASGSACYSFVAWSFVVILLVALVSSMYLT